MPDRIMPAPPVVYLEWVTVQQAAKLVGPDEKTIYDWISQERIASDW